MKFLPTPLAGAYVIEPELLEDERGFFARAFCQDEFRAHGLEPVVAQCNVSFNRKRGTLRGLHYQAEPHAEAKLVRCTRVRSVTYRALRKSLPTARNWTRSLTAGKPAGVVHPAGFARVPDARVLTEFLPDAEFYQPDSARWLTGVLYPHSAVQLAAANPTLSRKEERSFI